MSRFACELINNISEYVPGEQPKDKSYIKLNTNENPYYTSEMAVEAISKQLLRGLNRYSDPESTQLIKAIANYYNVSEENVMVTNSSDEALAFAFKCYGGAGLCYPDVTYGFYDVIANFFGFSAEHIPLDKNFCVKPDDYFNKGKTIVIANPNAQTGIELSEAKLLKIIENNPDNVIICDRAYGDFGSVDAISLTKKYKNLLTVSTFSKSRSLAGARVGYVIADSSLICDMKKAKNSFHPYNVNSVSSALATKAILDDKYFKESIKKIIASRESMRNELKSLGFNILQSSSNFILAEHKNVSGETLYKELKRRGALVRIFKDERIKNFIRITVGTEQEIAKLVEMIKDILR